MKFPFIRRPSIFKKLFLLTFLVAAVPIGLSWIYFIYVGNGLGSQIDLPFVYYGLFILTLCLAVIGAYYFSRQISRPITQFKNSALEIARGNFDHKISIDSDDEIGKLAKIFDYMTEEFRKQHIQGSLSQKKQIETILQEIGDGVIVTDANNKILRINSVAIKWFNLDENSEKKPLRDLIEDETLVKCIDEIGRNSKKKSATIEITTLPLGETKPIILQALASRIEDDEGAEMNNIEGLIGVATIFRDITREKEIDRLKTELVSLVAHELRSPLTCISGFSELLLDETVTRDQSEEYASIILKESNRLSELINKFLDISKIEAGKSQIRKTPVDIKMLVEKVLDFNSQLADRKKISVTLEVPSEVTTIYIDRDMMEQAILNVYSNAIKYSAEKAHVTVRITESEEEFQIGIEDTGFGISEESLPHIFDKFYRITDDEKVRDIAGSGLGLSLVKEIVEIHGGLIRVKSKLGQGSTFTVILPKNKQMTEEEYIAEQIAG